MKIIAQQQTLFISGGAPSNDEIAIFAGFLGAAVGATLAVISNPKGYLMLTLGVLLGMGSGGTLGYAVVVQS